MTSKNWVIMIRHDRWEVWTNASDRTDPIDEIQLEDASQKLSPEETAQKLAQTLRKHGYAGQGVALTLPSAQCLCAGIDTNDLPRRQARQTMVYRLEEKLPVAAEEVVADFIVGENQALGICVLIQAWGPVIKAFESAGVAVEMISPVALLALQHHTESGTAADCDAVLWADGQRLELFAWDQDRPVGWYSLPADGGDLELQLKILASRRDVPLRVALNTIESSDTLTRRLEAAGCCQVVSHADIAMDVAAVQAADRILAGKKAAWVDFCHGSLAVANPVGQLRAPLKAAIAAMLLLWACLIGTMWWRANGYQIIAAQHESRQATIYQELFPGQTVPLNVMSRLRSEHRRLAAMHTGDQSSLVRPSSALTLLHNTLKGLPSDQRYTILELQLDESSLYVEGLVTTHGSADAIATAIKQHTGWEVQPPRTEQLTGGSIGFTVRGTAKGQTTEASR